MSEHPEKVERDLLLDSQPILWAQAMLEEAEKCRTPDARDAILARIGMVFYSRFGVTFELDSLRRANQRWDVIAAVEADGERNS